MRSELIDKISTIVVYPKSTESDIDHLMTLIRKLQERDGDNGGAYPLLSFLCDWTKHVILNRKAAQNIITELNDTLNCTKNIPNNDYVVDEVSRVISFERLQAELRQFLFDHHLPQNIVTEKEPWLHFVINLINIISDCALELPKNRTDRVSNNSKNEIVAVSLRYTWVNSGLFTKISSSKNVLALLVTLSNTATIILPCKILGLYLTSQNKLTK